MPCKSYSCRVQWIISIFGEVGSMNILMLISTPFPPEEGIGFHVYYLSKNLMKMNHQVTIITRGSYKLETDTYENIKIIRVPFIPIYPFHVKLHGIFVNRLINKLEGTFDIIHIHNPLVPKINTKLPIVLTMHSSIVEHTKSMELVDSKSFLSKILGKTISYKLSKNLMNSSNIVLTVSESVADQIKHYYKFDKVEVIPNGVDIVKFHPSKMKGNYILYVGRLGHGKGIFNLLDASKIWHNKTDVKLLLAGKGELEQKIKKKIEVDKLNVNLVGHIDQKELVKLFANAKLFVFPSLYEGMPTALLEAMASGLPIITTSVSGCKDLIVDGYNGILIPPNSPNKLSEAVMQCLNNPNRCIKMGSNARTTAETSYAWSNIAIKIENIYKSLM